MKKFISLCLVLLVCFSLTACAKSDTGIPDDLVVVLPDGQELYLYMPREDAEKILGESDSVEDKTQKWYNYDNLNLTVAYKNSLLAEITIESSSSCRLKNNLSTYSKKSDFIAADFSKTDLDKAYIIEDGKYTVRDLDKIPTDPDKIPQFHSAARIFSTSDYEDINKTHFNGYPIYVTDFYCSFYAGFDH